MRKVTITVFLVFVFMFGLQAQSLKLDKTKFKEGESIAVHFEAPSTFPGNAWVGIVPSNIPHGQESVNDQHDLAYQYLSKKTSGTLTFKAPSKPGQYDFRMNDSDSSGKEVAHVTFYVGKVSASLRLEKYSFKANAEIKVHFDAPANLPDNAWVGIIPSNIAHGSESENDSHDLTYQYLKKRTSGTLTFKAPANPGKYDFRMNSTDNNGKEIAYVTFIVK
jgi:O-acetylhomoserine/O-acetylserine sulfhydrylase-like pyridoxal-dependent enzyme